MARIRSPRGFAAVVSLLATAASAKDVGYYDSKQCVDPSGFEKCYDSAEQSWADCVNSNCDGSNDVNCNNACSCVQALNQIDCAGQSCWNQVYSCEYQATANDLLTVCSKPDIDGVPFFPPPDDVSAGCSCNVGKIIKTQLDATTELDECTNNEDNLNQFTDAGDIADYSRACQCCAESSWLSAIYDICPDTDPVVLGIDDWYTIVQRDDNWPNCDAYIDAYPCKDPLGFSSPGGDFYTDGEFPANGTKSLTNTGVVTSPISGPTYTYTFNDITRVVTVASVDAKPTGSAGGDSNSSGGGDSSSGDSQSSGDSGDDEDQEDGDEDAASMPTPGLLLVAGLSLLAAVVVV